MVTRNRGGDLGRDTYFELVQRFPLRPIRGDAQLRRAQEVIRDLVSRPRLDQAGSDYLRVLADLVSDYEASKFPREAISDADVLAFLIESRSASQADVARGAAIAESTVSEVLAGKRTLTREHVARLAAYFRVGETAFSLSKRHR